MGEGARDERRPLGPGTPSRRRLDGGRRPADASSSASAALDAALRAARIVVLDAARRWDAAERRRGPRALLPDFALAKLARHGRGATATDEALRIAGGPGFLAGRLERAFRDARAGLINPPLEDVALAGFATTPGGTRAEPARSLRQTSFAVASDRSARRAAGAPAKEVQPWPRRSSRTPGCSSMAPPPSRRAEHWLEVHSPATGELVGRVPAGTEADVDRAVAAARGAFRDGRWSSDRAAGPGRRSSTGSPTCAMRNADELARIETLQTGTAYKLRRESDFAFASDNLRFFAGQIRHLEGKAAYEYSGSHTIVRPARADRRRRPGRAVELPVLDGDLEDRAGAGGRQLGRPQAGQRDAADDDPARPSWQLEAGSRPASSTS